MKRLRAFEGAGLEPTRMSRPTNLAWDDAGGSGLLKRVQWALQVWTGATGIPLEWP
jgi:hypothetical protein